MGPGGRFRVVICGAGIGGLTAAAALSEYPHIDVEIYESATQLGEIGAGIGFFPRPWEIIKRLGLESDLLKFTESKPMERLVPSFRYRKSDQQVGWNFYTLMTKGTLMLFHRADCQRVLLRTLPNSCKTHYSKRLRSYKQRPSGPIEVLFEDGSATTCDVLIGADGLKSAVRRTFLAEKAVSEKRTAEVANIIASVDPVWSGTNTYRALIPAERLRERAPDHQVFREPTQFLGKNGYIIAYPICHGKMINFVAFSFRHDLENTPFHGPWTSTTETSELAQIFQGWDAEVQALIECVERPLRWAIHTVRPLGSFISGRVALIGDAAHAMTPHQGSGAGQAVEDAYLLATVLGHPATTKHSLSRALNIYDSVRRPAALQVMEKSRLNGQYFSFYGLDFDSPDNGKQLAKLQKLGTAIAMNWEWAWTTSIDESIKVALRMLSEL